MFSIRDDSFFTRPAISPKEVKNKLQSDLIQFLATVKRNRIDFLPIMWQPALGNLGEGASAQVSQSVVDITSGFAFKRFYNLEDADLYSPMINEVSILSLAPIQSHRNIVNLEGICWEVRKTPNETGFEVFPVLVYEKAACDLVQFMNTDEGKNISVGDRLRICTEIGHAIMTLHSSGMLLNPVTQSPSFLSRGCLNKI